jgi:predicted AAA+ superfamily ATPase
VNLLDLEVESRLVRDPMSLQREVVALPGHTTHVVLDEIQKLPVLLDVVHNLIETLKVPQVFILTGSSARKLKAGGANLLAGRAAVRTLFPLSVAELESEFDLQTALTWGTLPAVWNTTDSDERSDFLRAYATTYLKDEIWGEQIIRNLPPFRRFLEVAALQSGKIINYSKIARDVGVDVKTVQSWYEVLQDTLVGFYLDAYHSSVRKQLRQAPKFYFFDTGVTRALAQMLTVTPAERTSYYGDLFEQFVVTQLRSRSVYENLDYKLSYLMTKSQMEIDLVVERPGKPLALIEIKSTTAVSEDDFRTLDHFSDEFEGAELYIWSRDKVAQKRGRIHAVEWRQGVAAL